LIIPSFFPQNNAKRLTQPHLTMLSVISSSLWRTTANFRIYCATSSKQASQSITERLIRGENGPICPG
jgi:hypothetical protein